MEKGRDNKMMEADDKGVKTKDSTRAYFFPNEGITVEASSQEEADAKLAELTNPTK